MYVSEARKLKALEDENARLEKLLADAILDNSELKDLPGKNADARCRADAVAHLQTAFGMSERRACRVLSCCRMTMRYRALRTDDMALRERMKAIAHERRRFGYCRLHVLLKRGACGQPQAVVRHLSGGEAECALARRPQAGHGHQGAVLIPMQPNDRWSLDFVSDQLTDGRRFRVLTVVDDCTRECLALVADTSLSGLRVAREQLETLMASRGRPRMIVSDSGTELT